MKKDIFALITFMMMILLSVCRQNFKEFEEKTKIEVMPVYDTNANKTTGLVNYTIAEKKIILYVIFFQNNEFIQNINLEKKSMLQLYESFSATTIPDYYKSEDSYWTAMEGRARVLLVNNNLLKKTDQIIIVK